MIWVRKPILLWPPLIAGAIFAHFSWAQSALPVISRIDFDPPEQPLPRAELDRLLPLKPESPFNSEEIREAIRRLYATGRYSDVVISRRDEPGGVVLQIHTSLTYFLSGVDLSLIHI